MICSGAWAELALNLPEYGYYNDPQLRALVWSLLSPGLVNEAGDYSACVTSQWCAQIYERIRPELERLDKDPSELHQWLEKYKSWRLGIRFEAYWSFIFQLLIKKNDLLSCQNHIQIMEQIPQSPVNKLLLRKKQPLKTLGEMDFVYQDKDKLLNHLEIAVKFYLLKPDEFGFERLIGPNGGDWYERKLQHLFKKQLALSDETPARDLLADLFELDADTIHCRPQGLIKGMIFFPVTGEGSLTDREQQLLNNNCLTGSWGTINNWYLSDPGEIGRWVIIDKLDWLVPQIFQDGHPDLEDRLFTAKEMAYKLKAHFHNSRRSILIARLDYDETGGFWQEQQRVMVVDKYWPEFKRSIDAMVNKTMNSATKKLKK